MFFLFTNLVCLSKKVMKGSRDVQLYMKTSQKGFENFNNIRAINQSVKTQLKDVWNNYFYNGSLWINTEGYVGSQAQAALLDSLSYNLSNSAPGKLTRGSVGAYNITMETYVQVGFAPTSIHGFTGYVKKLQGLNKKQIEQEHVDEIIKEYKLRLKSK